MTWGEIVVIAWVIPFFVYAISNGTILDFADIKTELKSDLLVLEQENRRNSSYKFEDFFWTGSGDDFYDKDEEPWVIEPPVTVHHTTTATVTTTIYTGPAETPHKNNRTEPRCIIDCITTTETIIPTPPLEENGVIDADREFWIVTVFKTNGRNPELDDLKNSLVKLYKKAFQRQQDLHLGIRTRRRKRKAVAEKPVNVYIHQVDHKKTNGNAEVEILYHVAVSGRPVSATTAVDDMRLVSDDEAREELGFPILIKAEPYLKPQEAQTLTKAKNTWVFIGLSIITLLIILILLSFVTLGCTKRKRTPSAGAENRIQIFERSVEDTTTPKTDNLMRKRKQPSPTYINFENQPSTESLIHTQSPPSTSSTTSLSISPLMKPKKAVPPKKPPRPKAALNKTMPLHVVQIPPDFYDTESNDSQSNSRENLDHGAISPKSFLSMPSVKSFPRANNPEPLNKVLEPVSMLHLDMPEDAEIEIRPGPSTLIRYGSVGSNADPGVIGPIVWDIHCLHHSAPNLPSETSNDHHVDQNKSNVTRMRRRFHELLDDTFSLFGSRMATPVEDKTAGVVEIKSKSAGVASAIRNDPIVKPRPRTSISQRKEVGVKPKGAWMSSTHSPMVRPMSAPRVNVEHVRAEGKFRESDPAIPLIAAIKTELQKCSLPGSTSDLNK